MPPLVSSWILAQIPLSTHCRYTPSRRVDIAGLATGLERLATGLESWQLVGKNCKFTKSMPWNGEFRNNSEKYEEIFGSFR
jgi:hypothetical protein